jgi:hypothetical protein
LGAPYGNDDFDGIVYGISSEALDTDLEDAPLRIYGESVPPYGAYFGSAMTNIGDVNADGNDDLAIEDYGRASIFHGPLEGPMLATDAEATVELTFAGSYQGTLAPAGDVDGDGRIDLLIGNPNEQPPDVCCTPGAAWLINGTQLDKGSTPLVLADWKIAGFSENETVGHRVASAGDIDGDGHAEVMVSAPGDAEYGHSSGAVLYFAGPLSGTDDPDDATASFHGTSTATVGKSLVPAVDVTGDGLRDLLIGAPYLNGGAESAVFIVPGIAL